MAFTSTTITHSRGRYVRHTRVTLVATLEGTSAITTNLSDMPLAVYAGTIQAKVVGGTGQAVTLSVLPAASTVGSGDVIYTNDLTVGTNPDYFPIASIFSDLTVPSNANFIGAVTLATDEWQVLLDVDGADVDVVTIEIGLLSHVLEV